MFRRVIILLFATVAMVAGGMAAAEAAPAKKKASAYKKVQKAQSRNVARVKKIRRKVNFTAGRRYAAQASKKRRPGSKRKSAIRMAALLGSASTKARSSRRPGQLYDASGRYLGKTIVPFKRKLKPGTILVKTRERALYYVLPGGKAEKYGVGVGREGFTWSGRHRITMKKEWPEWRPPEEMKQRELAKYGRKLPDVMPGGPKNPLGARALYIGNTLYRIHGTNNPRSIGKFVSSGCIRMVNDEVIELYDKVKIGARVIVED